MCGIQTNDTLEITSLTESLTTAVLKTIRKSNCFQGLFLKTEACKKYKSHRLELDLVGCFSAKCIKSMN